MGFFLVGEWEVIKLGVLYSMKIKKQTRKLAASCT